MINDKSTIDYINEIGKSLGINLRTRVHENYVISKRKNRREVKKLIKDGLKQ